MPAISSVSRMSAIQVFPFGDGPTPARPRESGDPEPKRGRWIPAFAGMSGRDLAYNLRAAVVQHNHIALDQARAETHNRPVAPHLGTDGLARVDRRRKPPCDRLEARRLVAAHRLQDRVTGDAEGREPVQDG